jgi:TrmH family RNA methyltransferase
MSPFRGDISSLDNPHVRLVRSLQDKKRARYREGRYVVEGHKMVAQALAAGYRPALAFFTADYAAGVPVAGEEAGEAPPAVGPDAPAALLAALAAGETALWQVSPEVMAALADTVTPQGIAAGLPMAQPDAAQARVAGFLLVLDNLRDPGNLGTILRTAQAAGVDAVALSAGCVDLYSPKVVRAGMGAHFRLAVLPGQSWDEIAALAAGKQVLLADLQGTLTPWQVDWRHPTALIIGNEAHGAGPEARALAQQAVRLPMEADLESSTLPSRAAVFMFEAQRQRRWRITRPPDSPSSSANSFSAECVLVPQAIRIPLQAPGVFAQRAEMPTYTRPTGFSGVPPVGPAMPVVETPTSTPRARRTPAAMAAATSALTAPWAMSISCGTPSTSRLTSLA